jgi:hypothetical protein
MRKARVCFSWRAIGSMGEEDGAAGIAGLGKTREV